MSNMKKFLFIMFAVFVFASLFLVSTSASSDIVIGDVVFGEYVDADGEVDDSLVTVTVDITLPGTSDQISILLTDKKITAITDSTKSSVIYIDQTVSPTNGTYSFVVEKSKVQGKTLYLKNGATSVDTAAEKTVTYSLSDGSENYSLGDITADGYIDMADAIKILRADAAIEVLNDAQTEAGDVNGDGYVDMVDAILVLRYDAGLDAEIGVVS